MCWCRIVVKTAACQRFTRWLPEALQAPWHRPWHSPLTWCAAGCRSPPLSPTRPSTRASSTPSGRYGRAKAIWAFLVVSLSSSFQSFFFLSLIKCCCIFSLSLSLSLFLSVLFFFFFCFFFERFGSKLLQGCPVNGNCLLGI